MDGPGFERRWGQDRSSSGTLKFAGRESEERSTQTRGTGYEASACFRALDVV